MMTDILLDPLDRLSPAMASAYDKRLRPNTYAVVHLKRWQDGIAGSPTLYEAEAIKVLARVSQSLMGTRRFRRLPPGSKLLPNMVTLEYGAADNPHLNILIRRSPKVSLDLLGDVLRHEWGRSLWASANGDSWFYCEERRPGSRVVGYCQKEGAGSLLVQTLTF